MIFINSRGDFCHGVGGAYLNLNNEPLVPGGAMGWMDDDDDTIAFANALDIVDNAWVVSKYHVPTKTITRLSDPPIGSVVGYAGGGHAAWTLHGLHSTTGFNDPDAGLIGMGPDGSIAYKPVDQSYGPTVVRRLDGSIWQLTPNHAYDLCLLDGDRAIWTDSVMGLSVANLPTPRVLSGAVYGPKVFTLSGVLWIGYVSGEHGLVTHPLTDPSHGWALVAPGVKCWAAFRALKRLSDSRLRCVWSNSEAEQAGQLTVVDLTLGVDPLVSLIPPIPLPTPTPQPAPKITVHSYDTLLKAGTPWHLDFSNSDGTRFLVTKDEQDRLWFDASNAAGHDATGAVRQLTLKTNET